MKKGFISSTVLDLKDLRDYLEQALGAHGFKMLASEKGSIPVDSTKHSYQVCIDAARECDFLVAIIDGRYGGDLPGGKSITLAEVEAALEAGKKVWVFCRQSVWDAREILRPYFAAGVKFRPSKIVGDASVFRVIDAIRKRMTGNWIFQFTTPTDILTVLSEQLGFEFRKNKDSDVDRLDKILARRAFTVFPLELWNASRKGLPQVRSTQSTKKLWPRASTPSGHSVCALRGKIETKYLRDL